MAMHAMNKIIREEYKMEGNRERREAAQNDPVVREAILAPYREIVALVEHVRTEISNTKIDVKAFIQKLTRLHKDAFEERFASIADFTQDEVDILELMVMCGDGESDIKACIEVYRNDLGIELDDLPPDPLVDEIGALYPFGPVGEVIWNRGQARYKAALTKLRDGADQ